MKRNYLFLLAPLVLITGCGPFVVCDSASSATGQSGSLARFAIKGDYLYTIDRSEMNVFDISDASDPQSVSRVGLPWDVETLFVYNEYLYVGAISGMYIYSTNVPTQPTQIAEFIHAQSCDPVVVQDDIAYVTLNSASNCMWGSGVNRLEVIDVHNPYSPKLIRTMDMWAPLGLGIDGNTLFICDGSDGLKLFDVNKTVGEDNKTAVGLSSISTYSEVECTDLIPHSGNLIVSDRASVRQFDYNTLPMTQLGTIE